MTTAAASMVDRAATGKTKARRPGVAELLIRSALVYVFPPAGRAWVRATLLRAAAVAVVNTLLGILWAGAVVVCACMWSPRVYIIDFQEGQRQVRRIPEHWSGFAETAQAVWTDAADQWRHLASIDASALIAAAIAILLGVYLVPFFVLLPFGTRPGRNKACMHHVARTVLLGSGLVHVWGLAWCATVLVLAPTLRTDYAAALSPMLLVFSGLVLWNLVVLVHAVRREYRGQGDMPVAQDPLCEECGYNLIVADSGGRCPECGRSVAESLGAHTRPPTAWEARATPLNVGAIAGQIGALVRRPRRLFGAMPTLTGQPAAQRWLIGSMIVVALLAALAVPALFWALDSQWSSVALTGALAMGIVWAIFGLMMVGIETTGIATFSRMRGHPIYLAAASKVTSYSAVLMVPWVILGGIQLVAFIYWSQPEHNLHRTFGLSMRGEQVALAASLAIAHIGGLLWYELTVYRGVRAIQFANK